MAIAMSEKLQLEVQSAESLYDRIVDWAGDSFEE
jgi:hypothetical protein